METENNNVASLVRQLETDYISGNTTISKYVDFSLSENIDTIEAYLNSKHISGSTDALGREKPFFNIVIAAANIWFRATDLDRKNIKVKATKSSDIFPAFLATVHLQEWMRKENFGSFLNEWGRVLSRYGSAVVKFVEADGELHSMVVPWNRLIVDPIDFDNDVVIEVLELTPAQLKKRKGYNKEMVEKLIEAESVRETLGKQKKDTKGSFIRLYEVHGEMPLSYLTRKDSDQYTYVQQMHVISYVESKEKGKFDDFTLVKGREEKNPYMITHLIKEDGRVMGRGAVENLFESQWMMNHTTKQIKDQLDLASKLIFQTSDGNFVGQNALNSIETGDILVHAMNQPLTQVANSSHDITSLQNFGSQWKSLASEINGISESMMGNAAPSGTAWRQVEALLQESHSLFELMTENKALHLEDMLTTYIIPHIKKKMDTSKEISATLESYQIQKIDKMYVPYEATRRLAQKLINALIENPEETPIVTDELKAQEESNVKEDLIAQGNQRFFKPDDLTDMTWKEMFKNLEWDLEIDITGEQKDNQSDMATLSTVLQTVVSNPQALENPKVKVIFNKILSKTGTVSPIELSEMESLPVAPSGGQVEAGMEEINQNV
jgi:hypothetical protein